MYAQVAVHLLGVLPASKLEPRKPSEQEAVRVRHLTCSEVRVSLQHVRLVVHKCQQHVR